MVVLRAHHVTMREELARFVEVCGQVPRFHMSLQFSKPRETELEHHRSNMSSTWSTVWLKIWGRETAVARRHFPRTLEALRASPLSTAMLSLLEPYRGVNWHTGYFNGVLRYHVAVSIPRVPPGEAHPRLLIHEALDHAPDARPRELGWCEQPASQRPHTHE